MFCYNCGKEIDDKAVVCIGCGVAVEKKGSPKLSNNNASNFLAKCNWIFAVISIVLAVNAVCLVVPSLYAETLIVGSWVHSYLYIDTIALVFLWIFTALSLTFGIISFVVGIAKRLENKFPYVLALSISISILIFAILVSWFLV